jgi:hypothetical protein
VDWLAWIIAKLQIMQIVSFGPQTPVDGVDSEPMMAS